MVGGLVELFHLYVVCLRGIPVSKLDMERSAMESFDEFDCEIGFTRAEKAEL